MKQVFFIIVFMVFFVWGIWSTITSYSSMISLDAEIVGFTQNEEVFMDARENESQTPIVSYQYKDKVYRDTISYKINTDKEFIEGTPLKVIINPEQPQFTIEESTSTFYAELKKLKVELAAIEVVGDVLQSAKQQARS